MKEEVEEDAPTQKKNLMEARVKNTSKRCMARQSLSYYTRCKRESKKANET